jgi:hypothetical protein
VRTGKIVKIARRAVRVPLAKVKSKAQAAPKSKKQSKTTTKADMKNTASSNGQLRRKIQGGRLASLGKKPKTDVESALEGAKKLKPKPSSSKKRRS